MNLILHYINLLSVLKNADREVIDQKYEDFGMREFKTNGTRFELNGLVFLRGTTECCIFPLTGYPPTDWNHGRKYFRHVRITD